MNESKLRALFGVIPDPEKNVIDVKNIKNRNEIERIVRIFAIKQEQAYEFKSRIKAVQNFQLVQSYN